tara:strand:+ start:5110 stop:5643 length:534 start_codon:yes stop_codon:yes gene_type:complete
MASAGHFKLVEASFEADSLGDNMGGAIDTGRNPLKSYKSGFIFPLTTNPSGQPVVRIFKKFFLENQSSIMVSKAGVYIRSQEKLTQKQIRIALEKDCAGTNVIKGGSQGLNRPQSWPAGVEAADFTNAPSAGAAIYAASTGSLNPNQYQGYWMMVTLSSGIIGDASVPVVLTTVIQE